LSTPSDSRDSITGWDRTRLREDKELIPVLMLIGSSQSLVPSGPRVTAFDEYLHIGRHVESAPSAHRACLVADSLVSSRHCAITKERDGSFMLTDLQSRNGTVVDGVLVKQPTKLRDGAIIFFGAHAAVFQAVTARDLEAVEEDLAQPFGPVATTSPALANVCRILSKLAACTSEILITGETGTGKEICAQAIHRVSGRPGRFVAINCAALPRELVESELFGFVRGAHSQARDGKKGLFEEADGGTLFLDEIGDMPVDLQAKLLRFLQDRQITPLGATRSRHLDVRVIAATSHTAAPTSPSGPGLRADLAARLGPEPLRIPPLRNRKEDLGVMIAHFLKDPPAVLETVAFQALALYHWPGNVRELEKVITRASVLARDEDSIGTEHLPTAIASMPGRLRYAPVGAICRPSPTAIELEQLLQRSGGNVLRLAREIDRKPAVIYRWCRRFRIDPDDFRNRK
jgi:transcriptional regulator with PAS, ATPase and Fis domain